MTTLPSVPKCSQQELKKLRKWRLVKLIPQAPDELKKLLQQHYETGLRRLLKQGEFCSNPESGACYYNHPTKKGISCIFGLLFDEETRAFLEEDVPASANLEDEEVLEYLGLTGYWDKYRDYIRGFFDNLQVLHDRTAEEGGDEETFLFRLGVFHEVYPWLKPITV